MHTITVTNLNNYGTGSLHEAIDLANAYTGTDDVQIVFDESLSGSTLNLFTSQPTISKDCEIIGNGFIVARLGLGISAKVEMSNLTLPGISLYGSGQVIPSNVVLTNQQAVTLSSAWSGSTDFSGLEITAEGAYVGLSSLGDCTLNALPASLSGGYKAKTSGILVGSGKTVTLADGVSIDINGYSPDIYGRLIAENTEVSDAFTGSGEIWLRGGTLELTNASIRSGLFYMSDAATLEMTGGVFDTRNGYLNAGYARCNVSLTGVEVKDDIFNVGTMVLTDVNSTGLIEAYGRTTLENVSCTSLYVHSDSKVSVGEGGLTLTGTEAMRLTNTFTGDTARLFELGATITAENAYVGIDSLGDCTLNALPESLSGGYKVMWPGTVIDSGKTVTLADGVGIDTNGKAFYLRGKLIAENTEESDAITGSGELHLYGGTLELTNASIRSEYFRMYYAATLEMTGGVFDTGSGSLSSSDADSHISLTDVEMRDNISTYGTLVLTDVTSTGLIEAYGSTTLDGVSCATLYVDSDSDVSVDEGGLTLTGTEALRLTNTFTGDTARLFEPGATITAENAYVGLYSLGDCTLNALPESLSGGYKVMNSGTVIASGKTVTLGDGVSIDINGYSSYIYGRLIAENTEVADAITGSGSLCLYGGTLELTNASIRSEYFNMYNAATLEMTGGVFDTGYGSLYSECVVSLTGVEVKDDIYSYGTLNLTDVNSIGLIRAYGSTTLDGVSCTTLYVDSDSDVSVGEGGLTLTGTEAMLLTNTFTGDTARLFELGATITAENAYVGLASLGDCTLSALPTSLSGGYRVMTSYDVIAFGKTVTLGDGVSIDTNGKSFFLYGKLIAENTEVADAITGSGTLSLYGGTLELTNASIRSRLFDMHNAATLEMTGGVFDTANGSLYVNSAECVASLTGVEVKDNIFTYGTLELKRCTFASNTVTVYEGASATIQNTRGIGTLNLYISGASQVISGNDFSTTTLVLNDLDAGEVIDLSGNYWGTTDIDAIVAKIQNYSEDRVLISSILMAPPTQEFSFDATMAGNHRLSHLTTSLTLNFNRLVDADTVNADSILLTDSEGNRVAIKRYEVSGTKVTLYFDELSTGDYRVNCTEALQDVDGKVFTNSVNFSGGITYHCLQIAGPRVLLFRSNSTVTDVFSYVDVFFDQTMDDSRISLDSVHLYAPDGQEVELKSMQKAGVAGNVFYRFNFDAVSAKGNYTFSIDKSVCNDWGMGMAADYRQEIYVAAPDLTVGTELDLSSSTLGRYTTITYTVSNIGDAMTPGTWTDAVYLCRTQQWNEDEAILLGRYNRTEALSENGSYTATIKGLLSGLEPGDYYVFVRTDESDRLSEERENNNVSATGTKISIGVPEFTGDSVAGRLSSANETLYYAFTPTESGSYILTVDDSSATVVVTSSINGKALNKKTSAKLTHYSVFSAKAGETYYIAIKGGKDTSYTTQIQKSEFAVYDSSFSNLAAGHPSTLTLVGSEFAEGMAVYVVDENGVRYDAERVTIVDSCQATVTFSLPEGLASGTTVTLYVQNEANTVVKLDETLHIASFSELVELEFTDMNGWSGAAYSRVGYVWKTDLIAGNKAGYDVSNAIILVTDTAEDFAMYYSYDDAKVRDRSALLFLGGVDALTPKVMTAGELGRLGVYVKQYRSGTGAIQAWLLDPGSTMEITDERWACFESALRPTACSDADWSAWWSDMKPRIGDTIGDFTTFIYGMRDAVSAAGQKVNVSSLADLTELTMNYCSDYVPGHVVQGELTEWGTGKKLSGVTLNLHKKVGDTYELIGSAVTDNEGRYSIRHDGAGTYYVAVPGLSIDADGDGFSDLGIPEFEIGEEDKVVSPHIVQGRSDIEYAENGDLGRLWMVNGYLSFSIQKDEEWSAPIGLRYAEDMCDSTLRWDDSLKAYVVFWNEVDETGCTDSFVQLVKRADDGSYQALSAVQIGADDAAHTTLQSRGEGKYLLVCSSETSVSCEELDLSDERHWQEIEVAEQLEETGVEGSFSYPIKMPFGKNTTANISGSGSIGNEKVDKDKVDPCKVILSYALNAGGSKRTWHGQYDWDKWSVSGSLSETVTYFYTELGEKAEVGSGSANLTITRDCPDGLIFLLKHTPVAVVSAIGSSLFVLKNALSKLKIDLDFGYNWEIGIEASWASGKATIVRPTFTVTVYGGVEDKVDKSWYVRGSGTFSISFDLNMTDISYVSNSMTCSGNLHYEVKTPQIFGWCYESSGDYNFGNKPSEVPEIELKRKDIAKMSMVRTLEVDGTTYTIISDEQNNFSNLSITANKNGELFSVYIDTTEFSRVSDLLLGRGYITDISCSTLGDYGVITVSGYVGDYVAKENVTASELQGILDTVKYKRESHTLYVKDAKVTDKWGSISDEEIPEGDKIQDTMIDEADNGKHCRVELVLQKDGKYALYYSEAEGGKWGKREKVTTCENRPLCIDVTAIGGKASIIYKETKFSEERGCDSHTYMWTKSGGEGEFSCVSGDDTIQTAGSTMIQSVISAIGGNPWTMLQDCPKKPKEKPDDEKSHNSFSSFDPNDFYGPTAYGAENWISPREMQFQILCENIPEENIAHAAMVTIKHKLDDAYDYSTFRLGDMMIGGNYIEMTEEVQSYKARLDWTSTLGVLVDVNAFFDADTGEVVWEFVAIDPETGWIVSDPFKGLLAPNYNPPEGDGWVYYYVEPKETTLTGTTATSQAEIIFDYNEPILTPVLSYTFDADKPVGAVTAVAAAAGTRYLRVDWSGTDTGSGVACYNVFVSVDGGAWEHWQENINATSALYTVAVGEHRYAFFAQAIDHTGLAEELAEQMPAEAATTTTHSPCKLTVTSLEALRAEDELTLRIVFSEKALCADWAAALQVTTSTQTIELSTGSFRYDESTHTLTWDGSVAGVPDGAQTTVRLKDGLVTDAQGQAFGSVAPAYSAPIALAGVAGSTYAAPALVDYNADGLMDVLVGEVAENGKGRIRIYLNEGTAEVASFATHIYAASAEDTPLELEASGCQGAIVRLADLTGDGKDEMVVGLADGTIRVFTAADGGHWADAGELGCLVGGESATVDAGTRAALEFVDANGDGRSDMLVGTGDGNVLLYLNTSAEGDAVFDAGRYLHDASGRIKVGSRVSVATGDFDGDGLWDMLLGTADGTVLFYRNEGSTGTPLFGAAEVIWADDAPLDMSSETNRVRIDTGDLDGDGIDDLVVGQSDGSVKVLYGRAGAGLIGEVAVGSIPLPKAPQNVQLTVNGGRVQISWSAVEMDESSAISYEISYCIEGSDTPEVLVVNETAHTLELADAVYSVQVRALNHGKGGDWSPAQRVTVDTIAPAVPAGMQAVGGETAAALSWNAVADAVSYEFRYRQAGSQVWRTVSSSITNASLESLSPAAYEWQVRATDAAGNASAWTSSASFVVTGTAPATEQYWASGLLFDSSGNVTGGYYDVNKSGSADSNLCWAAAAANILAWWQEQGLTTTLVPEAPQGAAAIYSTFTQNWENASGAEAYAFIWWLSGDSTSQTYANYVNAHYCGDSSTGAYYKQFYTAQTISRHTAQVSLSGVGAAALSGTWAGIYGASGMIALGIFRSISSGGQLNVGHSLTLWGFESDKESGEITEIYVTDSDDSATTLRTLAVDYDAQTGYYTISQADSNFKGYVLGTYTWLNAFSGVDIVAPKVTLSAPVVEKLAEGRIRVTLSWSASESATYVLTVDGVDYAMETAMTHTLELADGEHSYSVKATDAAGNVGTAGSSFAMDATAPEAVQGVLATTGKAGVSVSWAAVADAATYTLQYATKSDFSDAQTVEGITDTAHTLTGLPGTGTLYVRVSAADAAGNESGWSASAQTGLDITAPVVTLKTPEMEKVGEGRIRVTLSWSSSESATYVLTVDGKDYALGTDTSHTLELADGEHSYSVKATDAAGNVGTAGSSFAMDATAPEAVQGVLATTGKAGVSVTWAAVADAATYTLQYATKSDFSDAQTVEGITAAAHTLTGLPGTGTLYVRVSAADAAGNESDWSAPAQTGLDITAPDAVQGLEVLAQGTTASLSWDAASDASGIACYHLQLAVDGDFSKAQTLRVQELENTFFSLQADTDYQWRVAAEDGAGNVGSWAQGNAFRTGAGEVESITGAREVELSALSGGEYSAATHVYDWVGGDDAVDYFRITAAAEGAYCVSVDAESLESAVMVSVGVLGAGGAFSVQQELILAPGAAQEELPGMHVSKGESLYVKVESLGDTDDATFYELNVEGIAPSGVSGRVTRNNSVSKATVTVADGRSISGWVGAGDACDYYRVTLQNSGSLSMALDELAGSARLRFFRQRADGSLAHLDSRVVKGGSELERTLSLTAGTYYLEVAAVDGGLGCCNTTYRLTLEEESRQRRENSTSTLASM